MTERIAVTIEGGVADVRLTRADKMNALDDAMFEALIETGAALQKNPAVRAIVLSGDGRAFCAGLDMGSFARMAQADGGSGGGGATSRLAARTHGLTNRPPQAVWTWRQCPAPVIAAVHGVAFGGGFQLTLGADIRIVHPATQLSIMEIKWGLIPDMCGTVLLRSLMRDDVLRELTYTGRVFSGTEAVALGAATRASETPYEDALALAREIAAKSPDAIRAAKTIYERVDGLSVAEALVQESVLQADLIGSPNQIEAAMAGIQKRPATFADPAG